MPDPPALVSAYLCDTALMLRLFRAGVVAGTWDLIQLPKLILEMVRCIALTDAAVPEPGPRLLSARDHLWLRLRVVERSRAGDPGLDQDLSDLFRCWAAFAAVARSELGVPSTHDETAASGTPRPHPSPVAPYLHRSVPCVGLVDAAADAFAASRA